MKFEAKTARYFVVASAVRQSGTCCAAWAGAGREACAVLLGICQWWLEEGDEFPLDSELDKKVEKEFH